MTRIGIPRRRRAEGAFSLPELLVAMATGLMLTGVLIQGLAGATQSGERLGMLLRERQVARRTLALMRSEFGLAESWRAGPESAALAECALGGRPAVFGLTVAGRQITYSVGEAPSGIWRGRVLMRCGPAYGLSGDLSGGAAQNRVVVDALVPEGLQVANEVSGVVRLKLSQGFPQRAGKTLEFNTSELITVPSSVPGFP
jgi:hypothetical protein